MSRTCRSHKRSPIEGWIPLRSSRDAATSRGLRTGETMKGSAPKLLTASIQNGSRRQIRGSFTTKSGPSPSSPFSIARASSRNPPAVGEAYQRESNGSQSSQADPADARIRSFKSLIAGFSQNPFSLSRADSVTALGSAQPSRLSTLVTAEVAATVHAGHQYYALLDLTVHAYVSPGR